MRRARISLVSTLNQDAERIIQTAGGRSDASSTLRKDFGWTLFGNGIYAASQWAVLILLAKMGSPELVGHYSFAVAVATPVMAFAGLQLRSVQVTDVKDQHSFGDYLGFRIWTVLTAVALLTGICLMMRYPLQSTLLTEIIGLALAIETLSDLYYGIMQIHGHMDRIAKAACPRALLIMFPLEEKKHRAEKMPNSRAPRAHCMK